MMVDTQTGPTLGRLREFLVAALAAHIHRLHNDSMTSTRRTMAMKVMSNSMMMDMANVTDHHPRI
jgi:hypothetical protein